MKKYIFLIILIPVFVGIVHAQDPYGLSRSGLAVLAQANTWGGTQTAPVFNATTALQFNGANINTGGTLTDVAYLDQSNTFTGATQTAPTVNATTAFTLSGTNINTTGTLSNVAYKGQNNNFTVTQTGTVFNATTALQLNGADINTAGTLTNVAYKNQSNTFTAEQKFLAGSVTMDCGGTLAGSGTSNNQDIDIQVQNYGTWSKSASLVLTLTNSICITTSKILVQVMDGITTAGAEQITAQVITRSSGSCVIKFTNSSTTGYTAAFHISVKVQN
jgi:hypothetical protein